MYVKIDKNRTTKGAYMSDKYDFSKGRPTRNNSNDPKRTPPSQNIRQQGGSRSTNNSQQNRPVRMSRNSQLPEIQRPSRTTNNLQFEQQRRQTSSVNNSQPQQKRPVRSNVDINSTQSNKKPKKKGNDFFKTTNTFTKVIIVLFVVFVIYGFGISISLFTKSNLETMTLKSIDITKNDTYPAIVVRDEVVYSAQSVGYASLIAKDLEKIKKGSLMFTISATDETSLNEQLTQVEDEIFNLQSFREEYSNYSKDIDAIQNEMQKEVENFSYGTYSDINAFTKEITDLIDTRKLVIFADQRIADSSKVDTKQILESQIDENSAKYYSNNGGIVSYSFDGLEGTITPSVMKDFQLDQTKMNSSFKTHETVEVVIGDPVMRIVQSNTWYLGTYIGQKEADGLKVGDNRTLFVNIDGVFKELPARVYHVSDSIDKNVYVIFELRAYMQQFMNTRNLNIALKSNTYMNMKVPKSAIVYKEYLKIPISYVRETDSFVVIKQLEDGSTSTIPITIEEINNTNNYYYIDKDKNDLLVGSTLINPADATQTYLIPEVTQIPGVYKVNNGFADFVKVEINQAISSEGENADFVYILPSANLKEYDRILIHSNTVSEGDIID